MAIGSVRVFLVKGSGCGGCALEAQAALAKRYGAIRRGFVVVETPAHADVLLLCGPTPSPLAEEVEGLVRLLHPPRLCIRLGECAEGSAAVAEEIIVPGCPPSPDEIIVAVRAAWKARCRALPTEPAGPAEEECP